MKFRNLNITIPRENREQVNNTLLMLIDSQDMQGINPEEVFNSYTGYGALHGLSFSDFKNRHEYTEAKKEIEQGQFFTPFAIAEKMASLIDLRGHEYIADLTCGAGIFCNFFPEPNFFGCEIDSRAHKVAQHLYPAANLAQADIRYWQPPVKFDFVIGNPPFNLDFDGESSQDYFFTKAAASLRPAGVVLVIVPASFCADPFDNKREIAGITEKYNFLFQYKLATDSFQQVGVQNFATKIMGWQRKSESLPEREFSPVFSTWEEAEAIFATAKEESRKLKVKANSEMSDEDREFMYKVKKYLYEIKTQPAIKKHYGKAVEYFTRFRDQQCPANMSMDEWYKKYRISPNQVLSYLRRTVKKQSIVQIDKVQIVKTQYGFKVKAYSDKARHSAAKKYPVSNWSFVDIIHNCWNGSQLHPEIESVYKPLLNRKRREYYQQTAKFNDITPAPRLTKFVNDFSWMTKGQKCYFNEIQQSDLAKMLSKNYGILNWQQGSGKTSAAYAWAKFTPGRKTFVVSSALAINNTWVKFMKAQGEKFVMVETITDLKKIDNANFVLISHYYLIQLQRHIKKLIKLFGFKINLVLDESDEITNHLAKRTRAIQSCFRKVRRKLETTGTTTRNNIAELYTQLELLYNNSVHMMCLCKDKYIEDTKEGTIEKVNCDYYLRPFPAYYGNRLFKQCFNPAKTTVFGIQKHNQDLYNEDSLRNIIESTIITRKFKEIAGDKYVVVNHPCYQSATERNVYRKIINEFHGIVYQHFQNTGNARKETHLKLIRQINLLIKATSIPQTFREYEGCAAPNKALEIFDQLKLQPGRVAIGCITIEAMEYYVAEVQHRFPMRPVFVINGDVNFKKRQTIIDNFQSSNTGILICTQQSLKNSVSIPKCDLVFIESCQWNIPTIEQFYFRFIRYDSPGTTTVMFFNYKGTIEANLLALLMAKEKLNDFIKTLVYRENDDMYSEYGIDTNILTMLMQKTYDDDGHMQLKWGDAIAC